MTEQRTKTWEFSAVSAAIRKLSPEKRSAMAAHIQRLIDFKANRTERPLTVVFGTDAEFETMRGIKDWPADELVRLHEAASRD